MINAAPQERRPETETAPVTEDPPTSAPPPVLLASHELLRGQPAVAITHNGALYRLQTTRQGKLILTK
jgi:hemin uptake protein HemP